MNLTSKQYLKFESKIISGKKHFYKKPFQLFPFLIRLHFKPIFPHAHPSTKIFNHLKKEKAMKTKALISLLTAALTMVFFSCEEENTSSPNFKMPISFGVKTESQSLKSSPVEKSAAQNITFTKGHMLIEELEFEAEDIRDRDSLDIEFEIERVLRVDLSDLQNPDTIVQIPAGEYEEIEIEMELLESDSRSSIYLEGTLSNSQGEDIPLVFDYRDDLEFSIEGEADDDEPIVISDQTNPLGRITLSLETLFTNVSTDELENARVNQDGIIWISEDYNSDIYDKIADRLEDASEAEFED
jgi:PHD/YefM family antitoxin component YafN of YafNO toxin-antitoxin module